MRYRPHDDLIRPALSSPHLKTLVIGCVLTLVIYFTFAWLYVNTIASVVGREAAPDLFHIGKPAGIVVRLLGFGLLILALGLVLRFVHKRDLSGLIGPHDAARSDFMTCLKALVPLFALLFVLPMPEPLQLSRNLSFGPWLIWLPLALPLLLVQISAEELLFRGYLQSQLAARFSRPVIWITVPSVLFGLMHYSPTMAGDNAWMLVIWATVFGMAAADLTARTGTLGAAFALHFVNNIFAILVTAPAGQMDGLALYTFPLDLAEAGIIRIVLPLELMFTLCAWLTARLALRV